MICRGLDWNTNEPDTLKNATSRGKPRGTEGPSPDTFMVQFKPLNHAYCTLKRPVLVDRVYDIKIKRT